MMKFYNGCNEVKSSSKKQILHVDVERDDRDVDLRVYKNLNSIYLHSNRNITLPNKLFYLLLNVDKGLDGMDINVLDIGVDVKLLDLTNVNVETLIIENEIDYLKLNKNIKHIIVDDVSFVEKFDLRYVEELEYNRGDINNIRNKYPNIYMSFIDRIA